jgi:hypothetical protein
MITLLLAFVLAHFDANLFWWGWWAAFMLFELGHLMKEME